MMRTIFRSAALAALLFSSACLVTTSSGRPPAPAPTPGPTPPPTPTPSANGMLSGLVIDAATQQPIAQAGIELNSGAGPGTGKNAQTDASGTFQMPELTPGSYGVRCSREGYQKSEQMIEIRAGQTTQLTCTLARR